MSSKQGSPAKRPKMSDPGITLEGMELDDKDASTKGAGSLGLNSHLNSTWTMQMTRGSTSFQLSFWNTGLRFL